MPKSQDFTPGQRAFIEQARAEEHTVAVTGPVTKVEELAPEEEEGVLLQPARVRFTVSGDNGTATFEAVPPLTPEERDAQEAALVAEAEKQAEAAAAERDAEVEKAQAEAAAAAREERASIVKEIAELQRRAQAEFETRVTAMVAAEVEKRLPGASGAAPAETPK